MSAHTSRFFHSLQMASHRLDKAANQVLIEAAGVTTSQASVLITVRENPLIRQNSLALKLGLNESAITAMINRLIGMDMILRTRSDTDARAWELQVTERGIEALEAINDPFRQFNDLIDDVFGELADDVSAKLAALADRVDRF